MDARERPHPKRCGFQRSRHNEKLKIFATKYKNIISISEYYEIPRYKATYLNRDLNKLFAKELGNEVYQWIYSSPNELWRKEDSVLIQANIETRFFNQKHLSLSKKFDIKYCHLG